MINLSKTADKIFSIMVRPIDEKTKYDYTLPVNYEGCLLLIRPFIFSEIIMVSGLWETYVKSILDREIENNDVLIDIGANIGVYAIPFANRVSKVIAFEPHPKISEMLERSIKMNQLHNVTLIKKPVADGKKKILYDLSSVPMLSGVGIEANVDSTMETESVDLDTALGTERSVDWLIIDVEGFEVEVLNGGKNILRKHSPKIIIEIHSQNINRVKEILMDESYRITLISYNYYYAVK